MVACCAEGCENAGFYAVTKDQRDDATAYNIEAAEKTPNKPVIFGKGSMVCGRCVFDIVRCRLEPQVMAQGCHGNGRRMDRRDLVKDVLKLTGSHEALPASEAVVVEKTSIATQTDDDEMTTLFITARPFISMDCFMYSYFSYSCRHILHLNGVEGYVCGGSFIYCNTFEGEDVLRLSCMLYTTASSSTMDAFRGGAISNGDETFDKNGVYDLRNHNFLFPTPLVDIGGTLGGVLPSQGPGGRGGAHPMTAIQLQRAKARLKGAGKGEPPRKKKEGKLAILWLPVRAKQVPCRFFLPDPWSMAHSRPTTGLSGQ